MADRLNRTQIVPRPVAEVFAFFADARNLEALTPRSLHFHIRTPQPIEMRAGAVIDYELRLGGIPLRWRTLVEEFVPGERFVDVQARGPYKRWRHVHAFRAVPDGTEIDDEVEYELPLGPLGRLAHVLVVERQLRRIFDFRAHAMAERFGRPLDRPPGAWRDRVEASVTPRDSRPG